MARNPNPDRVTDALWYFVEQALAMEPGTQNGGTYAAKLEYHDTRDHILAVKGPNGDYSTRLAADKAGPGNKTAAFDWTFPDAQSGRYGTIIKYGQRIRAAFYARDPRLRGWREVLIQADPDGNAEGFDFTSWTERTPDVSHLWHGHFGILRGYVNDMSVMNAMLSVLSGESLETWRSGRSRYGGSAATTEGSKRMILGSYGIGTPNERHVWSDGNFFSEIPATDKNWLFEARKATASRHAVHSNLVDFLREVGRPVTDLIPKPVVVDVAAIGRELAASPEFREAIVGGILAGLPDGLADDILSEAGKRLQRDAED